MENIYNKYAIPGVELNTWLEKYEEIKAENADNDFITEEQLASMVNEAFSDNQNKIETENTHRSIPDLIPGMDEATYHGIIKAISPVKQLTSKKGQKLDLQRIVFTDDQDNEIQLDIWNRDIQTWQKVREDNNYERGDLVEVKNVNIREYKGNNTSTWTGKTIIKPIKKQYKEIIDPITPLKDITSEGTYHLQVYVLFSGETQLVGQNNTPLQKIVVTDDWEISKTICIWREALPYNQGDRIDIHVNTSSYQNELNFNYDNNYETQRIDYKPVDMNVTLMDEIEKLNEDEKINITGTITRIYNPIPYDKGHITSWEITLEDNTEIEFTMFREVGRNYEVALGDKIQVHNAVVSWDDCRFCKKLIHGYDTLIHLDHQEETTVQLTQLTDIQKYADEEIYIDIKCRVVKKNQPITYQRMDNTASTVTHLMVCDETDMQKMVVWGDQQVLIQYNGEYILYNVKIKENYDTNEYEIHCDNRTRVVEARLGIDISNLYEVVDKIEEDNIADLLAVEGTIDDLKIYEYPRCPQCNGRLTETMRGYYCDSCKIEPLPKMLWKAEILVNGNKIILWDDVAHSLIDPHINKEVDLQDQIEKIKDNLKEEKHTYCGTPDYNEKTDTMLLNTSVII